MTEPAICCRYDKLAAMCIKNVNSRCDFTTNKHITSRSKPTSNPTINYTKLNFFQTIHDL